MKPLHLELDELEIESLKLLDQSTQEDETDLDSMMIGHGMLEIGASDNNGISNGNSCCRTR